MIEVIYDQFRLEKADGNDLEVEEADQYEMCLKRIQACAEVQQQLRVFVRNRGMYGWFDSMRKKYGCILRIKDPLKELSTLMNNAPLPEFLGNKPELVVRLRLIEKASESPRKEGEPLDKWAMRLVLGSVWCNEELVGDEQLLGIINWYLDESKAVSHPAILQLANERLEHWAKSSQASAMLFRWLLPEPFRRCRIIAWEQLLATYPKDRVAEWLQYDGIWAVLSQLPDRYRLVPKWPGLPSVQLPPAIANSVRAFLKEEWENRSPFSALSHMFGGLDFEIGFILERLRLQLRQGRAIDTVFYDRLAEVTNTNAQVMELAQSLLPVSPPSSLSDHADISEVRHWLKEQYLPFYRSCARLRQLDLTVEAVTTFQVWFREHYPRLLVNGHGMAYRQIHGLKVALKDRPVLLIVVDGLDYLTAEIELLPALIEKGFYPQEDMMPYFTFLPSETPIAKPAILRGKMPSQIPEENPSAAYYGSLVQDAFGLEPTSIRAATNKDMSLEELLSEPAQVYLYLDNRLDAELLHALFPAEIRQRKYADHMRQLAQALADGSLICEGLFGSELNVVIASDHGYTEIPESAKVIRSSSKAKSRSTVVADESFVSDEVWELVPEDLYGLHNKMAVPWGYGCFGSRPKGATHGGFSPQEISVPWITVAKSKPAPMVPLLLYLEGAIYRRQKENDLVLCISNPNAQSIKVLQVQMQGVVFESSLPLDVAPKTVKKVTCRFDASDIAANFIDILGNYSLQRLGEKWTEQIRLRIETTGAMASEFDDDFDA